MPRIPFQTALLLAPLAYALHHAEEHLLFDFRAWRLRYFPDNNHLSTEAVLAILISVGMLYLLLHASLRTRASAMVALLFLMATQVHNAFFHLGGTILFRDFSPGLITAVALYLPVNTLIARAALQEGWVNTREILLLFVSGGVLFWAFEYLGPLVLVIATLVTWGWAITSARGARVLEVSAP